MTFRSPAGSETARDAHRLRKALFIQAVTSFECTHALEVIMKQLRVRQHCDRLLEGVIIVGAEQNSRSLTVAGDLEAFVRGRRLRDQLGEPGSGLSYWKCRHVQDYCVSSRSNPRATLLWPARLSGE